jgi:molybdate transport system ATP-binding protein
MDALRVSLAHRLRSYDLELTLELGAETLALAGPSGAGKSTLLRAIAGLVRPDDGVVRAGAETWLDTDNGIDVPAERRSVGLVFQDYALFPHLTVAQNVAFGGRRRAAELMRSLGLEPLAGAKPGKLSGGERQRVALARALARDPAVLLLDEPLAALDASTRASVREELRTLLGELRLPTLLVTHDYLDAAALAERVGVIVDGKIVQIGTPAELAAAPASPFVAEFTGGNVLHGVARRNGGGLTSVVLEDGSEIVSVDEANGSVGVVVYPWDVTVAREEPTDSSLNHVRGAIASVVPVGNRLRIRIGPLVAEVTAASAERLDLRPGERVVASFKATGTRLLPLGERRPPPSSGT